MSLMNAEDIMLFFEKNHGVRFIDARTGKLALEVLQAEKEKSDYDRRLETQDEATQNEHKVGAL